MSNLFSKADWLAYQSAYDKLLFKDHAALLAGFRLNLAQIQDDVASGRIENPQFTALPTQEVFIRWLRASLREPILYMGYHAALTQSDWDQYRGALFTYGRLSYQYDVRFNRQNYAPFDGLYGTGYDRCSFCFSAIGALAGLDLELARAYLPKDSVLISRPAALVAMTNLLLCLLYQDEARFASAIKAAEKAAQKKSIGILQAAMLLYLVAVLKKDVAAAGMQLQVAIDSFRQAGWVHDYRNPLSKFCPTLIYGLYFFSREYLGEAEFNKLKQPTHFLWRSEYIDFCKLQQYRAGDNQIVWRDDLAFLRDEVDRLDIVNEWPESLRTITQ